jgi:hypothetical protein
MRSRADRRGHDWVGFCAAGRPSLAAHVYSEPSLSVHSGAVGAADPHPIAIASACARPLKATVGCARSSMRDAGLLRPGRPRGTQTSATFASLAAVFAPEISRRAMNSGNASSALAPLGPHAACNAAPCSIAVRGSAPSLEQQCLEAHHRSGYYRRSCGQAPWSSLQLLPLTAKKTG